MRRLLALLLAVVGLVLLGVLPAEAATKNAGIPDLTPYGGYLGNYLAPDGYRVYCIDSPLPWPSGPTSGPSSVDTLVTTWGSTLGSSEMQKLNYVLLSYGQTDDPVQAAAVAAYVNAYTSGWARDLGAGYDAGAWYLNGNAAVTSAYDTIWADAEAHALPTGAASVRLQMADATSGVLEVSASPPDAVGMVTLTGAVRADTGESSFAVSATEQVPIRGVPGDESREYSVTASATYTAATLAGPSLVLYTTDGQQRTVRAGAPGSIGFGATASSDALRLDFSPTLTTSVASRAAVTGDALVDELTVGVAEGTWRRGADGAPVALVADGVLYGPFDRPPVESATVPQGAPVAGSETLRLTGPGEYSTAGAVTAAGPGYYTWVWTIDSARQEARGTAALPPGFVLTSRFGLPEETHHVTPPPRHLAVTGDATRDGAATAVAFIVLGVMLQVRRRFRGPRSEASGIRKPRPRST